MGLDTVVGERWCHDKSEFSALLSHPARARELLDDSLFAEWWLEQWKRAAMVTESLDF